MGSTQKITTQGRMNGRWFAALRKRALAVAVILPLVAALFFSTRTFFQALVGVAIFSETKFANNNWDNPSSALTGRRLAQQQFMNVGVHIPLENIIATEDDSATTPRMIDLMTEVCGRGVLMIWVPLRLRLPFVGDRVSEWCWVPKIKRNKK